MAIGCAKTRNQTRARECWFPVPIVAPVGPPVNFLQHFRDRQQAQVQRGFARQAWGSERNERPNRSPNGLPNLRYKLFTTAFLIM
jgi:hypothetical protein